MLLTRVRGAAPGETLVRSAALARLEVALRAAADAVAELQLDEGGEPVRKGPPKSSPRITDVEKARARKALRRLGVGV